MNKNGIFELIVGTFVLIICIAFGLYAYTYSQVRLGTHGYRLHISFTSVDGLSRGSDVRIAGIKVGSVIEEMLDTQTFRPNITIWVDDTIRLPKDSSAKITSYGFFGKNYISITPGGSKNFLKNGDKIIWSQGSIDLVALLTTAFFDSAKNKAKSGESA